MVELFELLFVILFCLETTNSIFIVPHLPTTRSTRGGVMELGSTYCDSHDGCASVGGHRPFRPVLIDESSVDGE